MSKLKTYKEGDFLKIVNATKTLSSRTWKVEVISKSGNHHIIDPTDGIKFSTWPEDIVEVSIRNYYLTYLPLMYV